MKTYLVSWKHNSGFQHAPSLIRGSSFPEAMTLTDVDDAQIDRATVSITAGFLSGDRLTFADQNGITGNGKH